MANFRIAFGQKDENRMNLNVFCMNTITDSVFYQVQNSHQTYLLNSNQLFSWDLFALFPSRQKCFGNVFIHLYTYVQVLRISNIFTEFCQVPLPKYWWFFCGFFRITRTHYSHCDIRKQE